MSWMCDNLIGIPKIRGIYQIRNLVNGKVYIGQAKNLYKRTHAHFSNLKANKNKENHHLQNAFNLYGKENFVFEILIFCEKWEATRYENAIKKLNNNNCYNIREAADSNEGVKRTPEALAKFSEKMTGRKLSADARKNMSDSAKRRGDNSVLSEDGRKRLSEKLKGIPKSEETKAKISKTLMGHGMSEETRYKCGSGNRGRVFSEAERLAHHWPPVKKVNKKEEV